MKLVHAWGKLRSATACQKKENSTCYIDLSLLYLYCWWDPFSSLYVRAQLSEVKMVAQRFHIERTKLCECFASERWNPFLKCRNCSCFSLDRMWSDCTPNFLPIFICLTYLLWVIVLISLFFFRVPSEKGEKTRHNYSIVNTCTSFA